MGFVEHNGRQIIATEIKVSPESLFMWHVYINADIKLRKEYIQTRKSSICKGG